MAFRFYFSQCKQHSVFTITRTICRRCIGTLHAFISTRRWEKTVTLAAPHDKHQITTLSAWQQTPSNRTQVPTGTLPLWVKPHTPAGNLLGIWGSTAQHAHGFRSHSSRYDQRESAPWDVKQLLQVYIRLTQRRTCPSCHTPFTSKHPRHQAATEEAEDPSCLAPHSLKAQSSLVEASACWTRPASGTDRQHFCGSLTFFLWSFQSLLHQRKNMHGFKFLPLKSYTKSFLDDTPADLGSGPDHAFQCAKETTFRVVAITAASPALSMKNLTPTPTPTPLPAGFTCEHVVAASAEQP